MKHFAYTLSASLIILSSCGSSEKTDSSSELSAVDSTASAKVEIVLAKKGKFEHFFEVQGTLKSEKNSILTPESGGKILSINVKEGQYVQEGSTIAVFDQSIISSNIKELDKNLEMAQYLYEKQKALFDQGVGSELQLKQAQSQYEALKQTKQTLSTQQSKFVLKAPYSGYVEEVFPVVGDMAGPASPIIRLVNLDRLSIVADISETYLKSLTTNTKVDIVFPAINDTISSVGISRMGKFINPANRTIDVEVEIPTKDKYIPNLMAVLKVRDFVDTAAIIVPTAAILEDNKGNSFVFIVNENNEAIKSMVSVNSSYQGFSAVRTGISTNDKVILRGARKLVNQEKVTVENEL